MRLRSRPTVAILLTLGLAALVLVTVGFMLGSIFFGLLGPALVVYCLAGLGVSFMEEVHHPAVDRRQTRRLLGGLLLLAVLHLLREFGELPALLPYTPLREQALSAFALVPPVLPWLFRLLRNHAFVRSGRALPWAMLLVGALLLLGTMSRPLRSLFVLPPEYTGPVVIEVADSACPPTPVSGSYRRFVIPPSGQLCTHPEDGWYMARCYDGPCSSTQEYDRWVYAGDEAHPLSTFGERPVITAINLGPRTEQHDRNGALLYRTQKLTFTVNPP